MRNRIVKLFRGAALASALFAVVQSPVTASAQGGGIEGFFASLMVRQGVGQFPGLGGCPVMVEYFLPRCDHSPAVLLLHGADGSLRYADRYRELGRGLAAKGYAAFFVHYFDGAPGVPPPDPDARTLPNPQDFTAWLKVNRDAITYIQNFCGVDPDRIAVAGVSVGGYLATALGATDPRVRTLIETSGGIAPQIAKNLKHMPPTLIIHGAQDPLVPVAEAYKLHALMWRKHLCNEILVFPCEGHLPFSEESTAAASERALDFLERNL
jgi:dipeptidyl aminopeptidase/acylaminoacyl peptidase